MYNPLDALRHLYGEGPPAAPPADDAPPGARAEYELLRTTKAALDRLPRERPDPSVIEALVREAGRAAPAPAGPIPGPVPVVRRAADRAAAPPPREARRRWVPLALAAAFLAAVAVPTFWLTQGTDDAVEVTEDRATPAEQAAPTPAAPPAAVEPELLAEATPVPTTPAPEAAGRVTPRGPSPSEPIQWASAAPTVRRERAAAGGALAATAEATAPTAADWEVGEDLRMLSLRLQTLEEQAGQSGGLAWDETPTPFGSADASADRALDDGIQAVRAGAPPPARMDVRVRPSEKTND
ncbi:MAG TPA: hypothetical protein VD962_05850 [Rubricoccaceae bacterium]|nr:hypothetical protein [Rubricoccaceae bacterium]